MAAIAALEGRTEFRHGRRQLQRSGGATPPAPSTLVDDIVEPRGGGPIGGPPFRGQRMQGNRYRKARRNHQVAPLVAAGDGDAVVAVGW